MQPVLLVSNGTEPVYIWCIFQKFQEYCSYSSYHIDIQGIGAGLASFTKTATPEEVSAIFGLQAVDTGATYSTKFNLNDESG